MSANGFSARTAIVVSGIPEYPAKTERFLAVPFAFMRDAAKLGPHATAVYLSLLSHRNNQTGLSFPGIPTIMRETGISRRQVERAVKALQPKWICNPKRSGRATIYRVRCAILAHQMCPE